MLLSKRDMIRIDPDPKLDRKNQEVDRTNVEIQNDVNLPIVALLLKALAILPMQVQAFLIQLGRRVLNNPMINDIRDVHHAIEIYLKNEVARGGIETRIIDNEEIYTQEIDIINHDQDMIILAVVHIATMIIGTYTDMIKICMIEIIKECVHMMIIITNIMMKKNFSLTNRLADRLHRLIKLITRCNKIH